MREIKFRAWDKIDERIIVDDQKFIPVKVTSKGVMRLSPHYEEKLYKFIDDNRFDLMQYTGLKDKNGKEVYEGDIVKIVYKDCEGGGWHSISKEKGRVYFDVYWGVKFDCSDATQRTADSWKSTIGTRDVQDVEVIGNIHENPELLDQNK